MAGLRRCWTGPRLLGFGLAKTPRVGAGIWSELLPAKSQVAPVEHHPAMPYAELPAFMAKLRAKESVSARALEFTILTVAELAIHRRGREEMIRGKSFGPSRRSG